MSLARIVFMQKKLSKKFGVVGKVAGRYLEAGFSVHIGFETPEGRVDIVAKKEGQVLAIDVVDGAVKIEPETVEVVAKKARSINAKPVLVLYGAGPKLTDEAKAKAKELGVQLRRIR